MAFGWGDTGHEIIGGIAERHLTSATLQEVRRLLGGETLAEVGPWADDVRTEEFQGLRTSKTGKWHFVTIPRQAPSYVRSRDCPDGECAVEQINRLWQLLATGSGSAEERKDALRFLVHLVGEVHQPLHCSDDGDLGSNRTKINFFGQLTNVHAVWDSHLIRRRGLETNDYVELLDRRLALRDQPSLIAGAPGDWATEAHRIAVGGAYVVRSGERQAEDYYDANLRPLEDQLMAAGLRLAHVLNSAFLHSLPPAYESNEAVVEQKPPIPSPPVEKEADAFAAFIAWLRANGSKPRVLMSSAAAGAAGSYVLGLLALLVLAWDRGSEFIARSTLRRAALAPFKIQPAIARWLLFLGYRRRLLRRASVAAAGKEYFGPPAVDDEGRNIPPDPTGEPLHAAIGARVGPQQPLFVLGPGGAGKSTLLARLAWLGVHGRLGPELRRYTPILVSSDDYEGDLVKAIGASLRDREGVGVSDDREDLLDLLQAGRYLILFDGVSEVLGDHREAVREILRTATSAPLRNCRAVITSRFVDADLSGGRVIHLQPLTTAAVETLLEVRKYPASTRTRMRAQIASLEGHTIAPLLFTMMLEAAQSDDQLSRSRARLYERYFRRLLQVETEDQWLAWQSALELNASHSLLATGKRGVGIQHEALIDLLSGTDGGESVPDRLRRVYGVDAGSPHALLEKFRTSGLLVRTRRWRFAHDTFEEYFAASAIVARFANGREWSAPSTWSADVAAELVDVVHFIRELADPDILRAITAANLPASWTTALTVPAASPSGS